MAIWEFHQEHKKTFGQLKSPMPKQGDSKNDLQMSYTKLKSAMKRAAFAAFIFFRDFIITTFFPVIL